MDSAHTSIRQSRDTLTGSDIKKDIYLSNLNLNHQLTASISPILIDPVAQEISRIKQTDRKKCFRCKYCTILSKEFSENCKFEITKTLQFHLFPQILYLINNVERFDMSTSSALVT